MQILETRSMNNLRCMRRQTRTILIMAVLMCIGVQQAKAQVTTEVEWQRCIGGSDYEFGSGLRPTSDGGFLCVGWSMSVDGDATGNHGESDLLVTKLNANGAVVWQRVLGGSSTELGAACMEATDGSVMVLGYTWSNDGDVSQNHGGSDVWVVKLDPQGNTLWQHCYGGSGSESGGQILETTDGGFVIHGNTSSTDGDVVGFHPGTSTGDGWAFKITATGVLEWSRALGGSGNESGGRFIQTADGGFLACFSYTESNDGDVTNYHGNGDCWLVKLSAASAIEWSRTVGGSERESGLDIRELSNGDFMLLAFTQSSDGDIAVQHGGYDVLLAKISSTGSLLWVKTYGGTLNDDCRTIIPTDDGGFILSGSSASSDGDVTVNQGANDVWVLKVDANGSMVWQRSFGGALDEWAYGYDTDQYGVLLSGITYSVDGDVQGHHGDRDLWFLKLSFEGDTLWQRCVGGSQEDWGYFITRTADGGCIAYGYTESNDGDVSGNHGQRDMWVVKLKVNEPTEPLECALYIPNAFSPDNSGKNDGHCLYGTECVAQMQLDIFDRWGNKVFESTDPNTCWDGSFKGQPLDPAVFVYHLSATLASGQNVEREGNITLMR